MYVPNPALEEERAPQSVSDRRKNGIGNAIAVPIMKILLAALVIAAQGWGSQSASIPMWADTALKLRYHPDVLDDVFPSALRLAELHQHLVAPFMQSMPDSMQDKLCGPDPGAEGSTNRRHRREAMGKPDKTHMNKNGRPLHISTEESLEQHVILARQMTPV